MTRSAMKNKKPRQKRLGLGFDQPTTITGMRENGDGSLTFFGSDGKPLPVKSGFAGSAYSRRKGAKVTFQIPDEGTTFASVAGGLARYDRIVGVDTNCRTDAGEMFCVTVVCELKNLRFEGPRWHAEWEPLWALEFRDPSKPPERIGWRHVIARGEELGWFAAASKTLLVVDAFLDDLHQINQREAVIIDDFKLPDSVSIAYASADTATDSPLNALISRCDKLGSQVLSLATDSSSGLSPLIVAERTPFRAHRYWKIESPTDDGGT